MSWLAESPARSLDKSASEAGRVDAPVSGDVVLSVDEAELTPPADRLRRLTTSRDTSRDAVLDRAYPGARDATTR